MKMQIDIQILSQFLREANKCTYANKEAPKVPSSRLKSADYHFEKDDLVYHDTYFGGQDFIGSEIVYKAEVPVWGMNYYGYVLNPSLSVKDIYSFLRESLMSEYSDIIPVRGPKKHKNGDWEYSNVPNGLLERFTGKEEISFKGTVVYRADYHGGLVE